MHFFSATFQIVTPMFLGETQSKNERIEVASVLRRPSVKGSLRFWWRALNWGHCLSRADGNVVVALQRLHAKEAHLFGVAADENEEHGQSKFLLKPCGEVSSGPFKARSEGHQYLLGQGLFSLKDGVTRDCINTGTFTLKILFKPTLLPVERQSIIRAILLWGLLGGLGSRSRKGWGSVAIQSMEGQDALNGQQLRVPQTVSEFGEVLKSLFTHLPSDLPPFTAFSETSRIDISLTGSEPLALLSRTGDEMQFYRSNGRSGIVRGEPAEKTFRPDHDLAQKAAAGAVVATHPKRVVFGLPHNYYFSSTEDSLKITGGGKDRDRRASPLFIHAHHFPQGESAIIQSLLPAQFLPSGDQLVMKGRRSQDKRVTVDWAVLHNYLDRFSTKFGAQRVIG